MWNEQTQAELQREFDRIGIRSGERVPTPRFASDPERMLTMLRRIPDRAGMQGYLKALADESR